MEESLDDLLLGLASDPYLVRVEKYLPSAWIGHTPFLKFLVREFKPKSFVELGVHNGFSFLLTCQSIQECGLNTLAFAVDHWQGDNQAGYFDESVYNEFVNLNLRYSAFSKILKKDFRSALSDFSDGSIDLLHIDGFHTYDAVKEDFESWLPKLTENGIVLLHDIFVRRNTFGVYKYWQELKKHYSTIEFAHSHGLGVVFIGDIPRKLDLLVERQRKGLAAEIMGAFGSLADGVVQGFRNENILEILELKKQLHTLELSLVDFEKLIKVYKSELEMLYSSRSWKITQPLRKIYSFFRLLLFYARVR